MIQTISTEEQIRDFHKLIGNKPFFRSLFGSDEELWRGNADAPIQLFWMGTATLRLKGKAAAICGTVQDWEELCSFLHFVGAEKLLCEASVQPACFGQASPVYLYRLQAGKQLSVSPLSDAFVLNREPSVREAARLLWPEEEEKQDFFYSVQCTVRNHGRGMTWNVEAPAGQTVSTASCTEIWDGEAYISMCKTVSEWRGRGLGSSLIAGMANELSAQGLDAVLLCEKKLCRFYRRMGMQEMAELKEYQVLK